MVYDTIIIGGGVSGCYLATKLQNTDFCLLECSSRLGGRNLTVSDKDDVLYEAGAWRIHSSHKRMLSLLRKYKIKYSFFEKSNKKKGIFYIWYKQI